MPKRFSFPTPFRSQRVNDSQTLLHCAWQYFYPIFSSIWDKLRWKIYLLVRSEILRLFVKTLTAEFGNIIGTIMGIYHNQLECNNLKYQKHFVENLFSFQNLHRIWNILNNNMSLLDQVFPKLLTPKNVIT